MKQFIKTGVAIAAFALSSMASAGPISATFTQQGASNTIDAGAYFDVHFDLTAAPYSYRPLFDTISSAGLMFSFKDTGPDNKNNPNLENFMINIGGSLVGDSGGIINIPNNGADFGPFSIMNTSLANLSETGLLSVRISATSGAFRFVSATLDANVDLGQVAPAPVPEPLSVALLGIGLAGIVANRRRKV